MVLSNFPDPLPIKEYTPSDISAMLTLKDDN